MSEIFTAERKRKRERERESESVKMKLGKMIMSSSFKWTIHSRR